MQVRAARAELVRAFFASEQQPRALALQLVRVFLLVAPGDELPDVRRELPGPKLVCASVRVAPVEARYQLKHRRVFVQRDLPVFAGVVFCMCQNRTALAK
eukprot:3940319-Rhodomonas_salina.2